MVILLGTHFMFREELGSRLRGEGYTVHPYDTFEDLKDRFDRENYDIKLVIVDLQHNTSGDINTIQFVKNRNTKVLALGEHKKTDTLNAARSAGADKVIINSQASDNIEKYVKELLS